MAFGKDDLKNVARGISARSQPPFYTSLDSAEFSGLAGGSTAQLKEFSTPSGAQVSMQFNEKSGWVYLQSGSVGSDPVIVLGMASEPLLEALAVEHEKYFAVLNGRYFDALDPDEMDLAHKVLEKCSDLRQQIAEAFGVSADQEPTTLHEVLNTAINLSQESPPNLGR